MKAAIYKLSNDQWLLHPGSDLFDTSQAQLILCFAAKEFLEIKNIYESVKKRFSNSEIMMCSTAGEIFHDSVNDHSFIAVALQFDQTPISTASVNINDFDNCFDAAAALLKKLPQKDLAYILLLSDGSVVDGCQLVKGLNDASEKKILITGGLAGDGAHFKSTLAGLNQQPGHGNIIAAGFYGNHIKVTHGSKGGWERFGPERIVTRSEGNKLFEIDHKLALDLYKRYLGPDAEKLPGSALLFPLSVIRPGTTEPVVRTILSIDDEQHSMTFAGGIPESSRVRFMKSNFDQLTTAASGAAQNTIANKKEKPAFSLLISCVGRKLVLGSRTEEEVEAVLETLGEKTPIAGFYSYGEISPFNEGGECQLHNQTMTITSFYELS